MLPSDGLLVQPGVKRTQEPLGCQQRPVSGVAAGIGILHAQNLLSHSSAKPAVQVALGRELQQVLEVAEQLGRQLGRVLVVGEKVPHGLFDQDALSLAVRLGNAQVATEQSMAQPDGLLETSRSVIEQQ